MVTFRDHRSAWLDHFAQHRFRPLDLAGCTHLVVVAAHPDDETLGAGALIATAAAAGIAVDVIVATAGEGSHPHSPTHSADQIATLRRREVTQAVRVLAGNARLHRLGFPDGSLSEHVDELTHVIRSSADRGPGTWIVTTWRHDGHPDHEALGAAGVAAAAALGAHALEYPLWAWVWTTPDESPLDRDRVVALVTDDQIAEVKRTALAEYRSQLLPLSDASGDEPVVSVSLVDHAQVGTEYFLHQPPPETAAAAADSHGEDGAGHPAGSALPAGYFDHIYAQSADPWHFTTSFYEARKRALTLAVLPRERFTRGFEPGCSIGTTTELLAARCQELVSVDISDAALATARERLAGVPHVRLGLMQVPAEWPGGEFDLIVLSEMLYYLTADGLDALIERACGSLTDDGVIVACHWRHPSGYPLLADEVHDRLRADPRLAVLVDHREEDFLLDVFVRPPAVSIAAREGKV